jgi:choice-of-anchor B domain-containing protein
MKKIYLVFVFLFAGFISYSQVNMSLLANLDYVALHNTDLNDIWGYVDETGNEYALVGTKKGTSIVDVSNPSSPVEVFWLPGMTSTWRDLKVWDDHLYVTTEAQQGLTIIDLTPLPQSTALTSVLYTGPSGAANQWESAHNLYIDENGYAYIFGANRGNGGIIILDVHTNPMAPIEVGVFDDWYAHDGYARNDTLFGAHVSDGFFSIVNVVNKANPILLGVKSTPNFFTHNIWESSDGTHVFTTDEKSGAFIAAYDITNTASMVETDRIQSNPGSGVIPHNAHTLGDFVITSYYRDGVTIHDVSRPNNLVEVGNFDSSPLSGNGFNGCWGAYPYLPSGNILLSDIENGLFVLGATYVKGCYVEGIVTDSITTNPLQGVKITIQNEVQTDLSKANGTYAVSTVHAGSKTVKYSKQGYKTKTLTMNLVNGQLINQNVELSPLPPYPFTLKVVDQATNAPINNADIRLLTSDITHEGQTNSIGEEAFVLYYQQVYDVAVGKWGYVTHCENILINQATGVITIALTKGIYDDFTFDFGWNVSGTATTGQWVREIPYGGPGSANAAMDADYDCSQYAYVTGNAITLDADDDDVDNGTVVLVSPSFDVTSFSDPYINYSRYFLNDAGPLAMDDTLRIILSNGTNTATIDKVGRDEPNFYKWIFKSIRIQDYLTPTATMTLIVRTSDLDPNVNITEAGFDFFSISNSSLVSLDEQSTQDFKLYPNPVGNAINVSGVNLEEFIYLFDSKGILVESIQPKQTSVTVDLMNLSNGFYYLQQGDVRLKFIKN